MSFGGISTRMTLRSHLPFRLSFHRCPVTGWFHVLLYLNYSSVWVRTDQTAQAVSHRAHSAYLTIPGRGLFTYESREMHAAGKWRSQYRLCIWPAECMTSQKSWPRRRERGLRGRSQLEEGQISKTQRDKKEFEENAGRYQCLSLAHSQTFLWGPAQWPTRMKCRGGMSD